MALVNFPLLPGVYTDDTSGAAEGYVIDCDNVRVVQNGALEPEWETKGGWEAAQLETFEGIARGGHAWSDLLGQPVLAWGTQGNLYARYLGEQLDITPLKSNVTLSNPFTTVSGSPIVTVRNAKHGLRPNDAVSFALADAVGGITVDGDYTVTEIVTNDIFTITHGSNATSTVTTPAGGNVEFQATLDTGLTNGLGGIGYGTGLYGTGVYGGVSTGDVEPRYWSIANFGNNLLALPQNGALYEYQPVTSYADIITNGDFASADDWEEGDGWTIGSGVATATAGVASDLKQDLTGRLSGGVTYLLTFDATVSAGSVQFRVYNSDAAQEVAFGTPISKTGSYSRRFQASPSPTYINFAKDASFAGTIDNVSISIEDQAYRIQDAPQYSRAMFVDPQAATVVLLGTVEVDGDYNAMAVRWSDQANNRSWTPGTDTIAGEHPLQGGSRLIGGIPTASENLIWSDTTLFSMRFAGTSATPYRFKALGSNCGLLGRHAVAEFNGTVFWASKDNFHIYRGGTPEFLPCSLRKYFFDNLAPAQEQKVFCGITAEFGEVTWFYPDVRDGTEVSRYVTYNWLVNCWYHGTVARSTWVPSGVFSNPIGFSTNGEIFFHERGQSANGDALSWYLETGYFDIGDGDQRMIVTRFVPDFKGQSGRVRVRLNFRQFPNSAVTTFGPYDAATNTEKIDFRHTGRQMSLRLSGSQAPAYARTGAFKMDIEPSGARR